RASTSQKVWSSSSSRIVSLTIVLRETQRQRDLRQRAAFAQFVQAHVAAKPVQRSLTKHERNAHATFLRADDARADLPCYLAANALAMIADQHLPLLRVPAQRHLDAGWA